MRFSVLFSKMMALTFSYLVIIFAGGCSAGVVPQNFKSNHDDPLHSEMDQNSSSSAPGNFEIQNGSSTAFEDDNLRNASQTSTVDVEDISGSSGADVFEESHSVKTALKGRSKKKTSKESISRSKKNFRKGFVHHVENDAEDHFNKSAPNGDHLKAFVHPDDVSEQTEHVAKYHFNTTTSNGDNLGDFSHHDDVSEQPEHFAKDSFNTTVSNGDNLEDFSHHDDISEQPEHVAKNHFNTTASNENNLGDFSHPDDVSEQPEHFANDHLNIQSNHSVDFVRESNLLENISKKLLDTEEKISKNDLFTNALNAGNHIGNVTVNLNFNNSDSLNESTIDSLQRVATFGNLTKPLTELKMNSQPTSENDNDTLKDFVTPQTSDMLTEHFDDTSGQLNQAAASLANSKLFLNIHNSFMKLNRTDRSNSTQFNHIDKDSSENQTSVHEDLGKKKIDGENVTSFEKPSESEITIEFKDLNSSKMNHKMPLNDTEKLSFEIDIQASDKNEDEIDSTSDFSDDFIKDHIITSNKSELINSENIKPVLIAENNATQGLFSTLSFDFLINSELVKNAASALEVFNFTDSDLTDHIIDDNSDMHDFLDLMHSVDESNSSNVDHTLKAESSTIDAESSTQVDWEENHHNVTVTQFSNLFQEGTFLDHTNQVGSESDPISPLLDSASSENDGNFEFTATNHSQARLNSTVEFEVTTMLPQPMLNSTVEFEVTTMLSQPMLNSTVEFEVNTTQPMPNSSVEVVNELKCPPPGLCIFWFFAQDTCAVNNHCLGSRICCRRGCAKTCIEV